MSRAQDLLDEAIAITKTANAESSDTDLSGRLGELAGRMESQRDKFFFKSLQCINIIGQIGRLASLLEFLIDLAKNAVPAVNSRPNPPAVDRWRSLQ